MPSVQAAWINLRRGPKLSPGSLEPSWTYRCLLTAAYYLSEGIRATEMLQRHALIQQEKFSPANPQKKQDLKGNLLWWRVTHAVVHVDVLHGDQSDAVILLTCACRTAVSKRRHQLVQEIRREFLHVEISTGKAEAGTWGPGLICTIFWSVVLIQVHPSCSIPPSPASVLRSLQRWGVHSNDFGYRFAVCQQTAQLSVLPR